MSAPASLTARIARAPRVHDADRAAETAAAFSDLAPELRDLLAATASCSPHLATLMSREADWLREIADAPPEDTMRAILAEAAAEDPAALGPSLRVAKRRAALLIALADLGGAWALDDVTAALTALADRAVALGLEALVRAEIARGKLPGCGPDDAPEAAGMFVLAVVLSYGIIDAMLP